MKRSEMIKKLDDIINSQLYTEYQFDEDMISELLLEIEKAGMLPPYNPRYLDHGAVQDCEWEPEDEA